MVELRLIKWILITYNYRNGQKILRSGQFMQEWERK
ncbi:unnamed protein product [Tenebrio molitor]|nr:unnamed protein product [Tenebrio molitor]